MGLLSYGKTSGRKGLHVYVPLNRKETTFEDTKTFSKAVAGIMQEHYPDLVTAKMAKVYSPVTDLAMPMGRKPAAVISVPVSMGMAVSS